MQLILSGHSYRYECENLCRLFFPYSPVRVGEAEPEIRAEEPCAFAGIERKGGQYHYTAKVSDGKNTVESSCEREVMEEYSMTNLLYRAFVELTGYQPAWGMLSSFSASIAGNWGKNVVQRSFVRAAMSARGRRSWLCEPFGPRARL